MPDSPSIAPLFMTPRTFPRLSLALLLGAVACAGLTADPPSALRIEHDGQRSSFSELADHALATRAVLIGEAHDRLDHHDNQLEILGALYARGVKLAIGLEAFEQPAQEHLDAFVAGRLDTRELLRRTRWYQRWRYDFRLYEPVLNFARERKIPLLALNVPIEVVRKVGAGHTDQLSTAERAFVPAEMDRTAPGYRERLNPAWVEHGKNGSFEHFLDAQLLWDEGMADAAARYLRAHPDRIMVIVAGNGHVEYGQGIARRLARRIQAPVLTTVQTDAPGDPALADFVLRSPAAQLADPVRLGVSIEFESAPAKISGFSPDSPAERAGLRAGDAILTIEDIAVSDYFELRAALHGRPAGEIVQVGVRRQGTGAAGAESVAVTLY
jgi:uncharacterized iron-regulated protein